MKHWPLLSLLILAPACRSVQQSIGLHHADPVTSRSQFARIKTLEGVWTGKGGDHGDAEPVEMRYRVTAGGSAVEETLFPGTPHEMISMYFLNGDRLMMTHYCAAGNQPTMVAANWRADTEPGTIRFEFDSATNMSSSKAGHMHEMQMNFDGQDRMQSRWTYFQDGAPSHEAVFEMTRKSSAPITRAFTSVQRGSL